MKSSGFQEESRRDSLWETVIVLEIQGSEMKL